MVRANRTYESHVRNRKQIKFRRFGEDPYEARLQARADSAPQLSLLMKPCEQFERSLPVPYEILLKIFHEVVRLSEHPIEDLHSLARVSEPWRIIITQTPSLWTRINFNKIPLTDGNLRVLRDIFSQKLKTRDKTEIPGFLEYVQEVSLKGPISITRSDTQSFIDSLITSPNLHELNINKLEPQNGFKLCTRLTKTLAQCKQLRKLSIKHSRTLFNNQKWLTDFLTANGQHLEELYLTSSMATIHMQLFRSLSSHFCPALRVIDLSTCDSIQTHSFDAVRLVETMPNLEVLRAANVSFRRTPMPNHHGLVRLQELSMPIAMRDTDRDDALLATLAYGSDFVHTLDLRGSCISAHALIDMPSANIRALHIDDICPITRNYYCGFILKWRHSLEVLSLVKINCAVTIRCCLNALTNDKGVADKIRELDLQSSEVEPADLRKFLEKAIRLQKIDLSSCRSLPRGCKGVYCVQSRDSASIQSLRQKLGMDSHSDSDTEIDEDSLAELGPSLSRKRRRVTKKLIDYVYDDL